MTETAPRLVIDGGERTFTADLTVPDPVPTSALQRVEDIIKSARMFRYSGTDAEESETALLEKEFAEYLGVKYALAVSSCSSAIFIGLLAAGIERGEKVLMPAFTFTAVPSSIVHAGAVPLLVECDDNYVVNLDDLEQKIAANPDVRFFLLSHMRGHVADMGRIVEICKANNILLIEDAAHALGSTWKDQPAGTFADIGCFSFQSTKMINAGEGGMLTTNDEDIYAKAVIMSGAYEKQWTKHFARPLRILDYLNKYPAYNVRMNEVTAAIARPQINIIDRKGEKFRANYFRLANILKRSKHIDVPDRIDHENPVPNSIQFNLRGLRGDHIRTILDALKQEGIGIKVFGMSEDNARCFWNWRYLDVEDEDLPITEKMLKTACDLRLPVFLETDDIDTMGALIVRVIDRIQNTGLATPA